LEAQQRSIEANPDHKLNAYYIDSDDVRARNDIRKLIAQQVLTLGK
jgi:hypothetical protein